MNQPVPNRRQSTEDPRSGEIATLFAGDTGRDEKRPITVSRRTTAGLVHLNAWAKTIAQEINPDVEWSDDDTWQAIEDLVTSVSDDDDTRPGLLAAKIFLGFREPPQPADTVVGDPEERKWEELWAAWKGGPPNDDNVSMPGFQQHIGARRLYAAPMFGGRSANHFATHSLPFRKVVAEFLGALSEHIGLRVAAQSTESATPAGPTNRGLSLVVPDAPAVNNSAEEAWVEPVEAAPVAASNDDEPASLDERPSSEGHAAERAAPPNEAASPTQPTRHGAALLTSVRRFLTRHRRGAVTGAVGAVLIIVAVMVFALTRPGDVEVAPPPQVVVETIAEAGWGPSRALLDETQRAGLVSLNSVSNNPSHGFEPNFAQVRSVNASNEEYTDQLDVTPGGEYVAYAYFHNSATDQFPASVAEDVRMRAQLPAVIRGSGVINMFVESPTATPALVWDSFALVLPGPTDQVAVRYVPGSATIHTGGAVNGEPLNDEALLSPDGALLGCDSLDGRLPPGDICAGYVTFRFVIDQPDFEVSVTARKSGTHDQFTSSPSATTGDKLDVLVEYINSGTTRQSDVTLDVSNLPSILTYVNGSSKLLNATTDGELHSVADDVASSGYNLGTYEPNANAFVLFEAVVNGSDAANQTGSRWLTTDDFARVTTANGVKGAPLTVLLLGDPPAVGSDASTEESGFWAAHWGPQREMFTVASGGSPYPSFNSILDNPVIGGDERNFVGLRPVTADGVPNVWSNDVWANPGDRFVARVYVNNSGKEETAETASLQQARLRVGISSAGDKVAVFGELSAINAVTVWDGATIHIEDGSRVVIDTTSLKLENNAHSPDGLSISADAFGQHGTPIGYEQLDGTLRPGYENDGYVTFILTVE
ncbi:hypothetical protein [Microbacterium enclense]|uniref:hypothetical protein n=1 Tax=Microbacterium enclense TaxID=993073 RepID=UPI003433B5A6